MVFVFGDPGVAWSTELTEIERVQQEMGITLDPHEIPKHIAIIMDGNGRWATRRGLPRTMGHYQGYLTLREIVRACSDLGVRALTVYAFSTENWRRPKEEVYALMELYAQAARAELPMMIENNVRLHVIGRLWELPESVQQAMTEDMATTSTNTGLTLNLALNYGGRAEIVDALRQVCRHAANGQMRPEDITEEYFSNLLYTAGQPDPDLLIRTAGELRVSNFLLWQIAYAEIWVTPTLWPDFSPADLVRAIADYQRRTRRFGTVVDE